MATRRMAQVAHQMCACGVKAAVTEATDQRAREFFSPAFKVGAAGYGIAPPAREQSYVLNGVERGLGDWWPPSTWFGGREVAHSTEAAAATHTSGGDKGSQGDLGEGEAWVLDAFIRRDTDVQGEKSYKLTSLGTGAAIAGGLLVLAGATGILGRVLRKR